MLVAGPGMGNLLAGSAEWLCCLFQLSLQPVLVVVFFRLSALLLAAFSAFLSLLASSSSGAKWSCSYSSTIAQPYSERSATIIRFCLAVTKSMVQLNLNLTHAYRHTCVSAHFTRVKVYNLACITFVACGFVVRTCTIKHSWHTRHALHQQIHHERTSSKPCMKHTWCTTP